MPFWSGLRSLSCKAGKGDTDIRKKAQNCVEGAVEEAMEERVFQSQSRNQVVFVRIRKGLSAYAGSAFCCLADKLPCLLAQLFKQNALGEGRGV